jgi:hypothetical protein
MPRQRSFGINLRLRRASARLLAPAILRFACLALLPALGLTAIAAHGASLPAASPTRDDRVVFRGNVALPNEVYLALLELPPGAPVTAQLAQEVRNRVQAFLERAGYELARVEATAKDGRILVDIDEGRVEKVVLRGQGSVRTVQALLALSLPNNVFNRPYLERRLASLKTELGLEVEKYELVRCEAVEHVGPQLGHVDVLVDQLGSAVGDSLLPPARAYELHIIFKRREWMPGFGLIADLGAADGLRLGLDYRGAALLLPRDRFGTAAQFGTKIRSRLDNGHSYLALSRAELRLDWYTPPLVWNLRPRLMLGGQLTSRQRPDLGIEDYLLGRGEASLGLAYDLRPGVSFTLAGGMEARDMLRLERTTATDTTTPSTPDLRVAAYGPYLSATLENTFDPDLLRRDRHHELDVGGWYRPVAAGSGQFGLSYRYQDIVELGWHDLIFASRGAFASRSVGFVDEQPVGGTHVRGIAGEQFYARRVASYSLGFRLSLVRDLYKVGIFHDGAVFGDINRATGREAARYVGSVGAGFHILVADAFQADIDYAIGFVGRDSPVQRGFVFSVKQAY